MESIFLADQLATKCVMVEVTFSRDSNDNSNQDNMLLYYAMWTPFMWIYKNAQQGVFVPMIILKEVTYRIPEIEKETLNEIEGILACFETRNNKGK